jgi:hypothetical protein
MRYDLLAAEKRCDELENVKGRVKRISEQLYQAEIDNDLAAVRDFERILDYWEFKLARMERGME